MRLPLASFTMENGKHLTRCRECNNRTSLKGTDEAIIEEGKELQRTIEVMRRELRKHDQALCFTCDQVLPLTCFPGRSGRYCKDCDTQRAMSLNLQQKMRKWRRQRLGLKQALEECQMRWCIECKNVQPHQNFHKGAKRCKACCKKYQVSYYIQNQNEIINNAIIRRKHKAREAILAEKPYLRPITDIVMTAPTHAIIGKTASEHQDELLNRAADLPAEM